MEKERPRFLEYFLYIFTIVILCLFLYVVGLYRGVFGGGLSESSSDWSNFGGFFGDSFSALIAFATLIAIIITIQLQRKLIENQTSEYERLYSLQKSSLDSQVEQLTLSRINSEKSNIEVSRQSFLNLINQKIQLENENINYLQTLLSKLLDIGAEGTEEGFQKSAQQKDSAILKRQKLSSAFLKLSITNYNSLEELKEDFIEEYRKITEM